MIPVQLLLALAIAALLGGGANCVEPKALITERSRQVLVTGGESFPRLHSRRIRWN